MNKLLSNIVPLKTGGQKDVFTAYHPSFGNVVYKIIKNTSQSYERTKREIRAVSILGSNNVPRIYAHNCENETTQDLWIIEERIYGETLRDSLNAGRVFIINEVVQFIDTMLDILVIAENKNLVHRDIKPDNIIINNSGDFYLLDFGIARHLDLESITATNSPFGVFTIGYASSEQFRNEKSEIDIRADLFSVGVVAHEMITGSNFYITSTGHDVLRILRMLENTSIPPIMISGDVQFQLTSFIKLLGDHRRTRRPRTAAEAQAIFVQVKQTLNI